MILGEAKIVNDTVIDNTNLYVQQLRDVDDMRRSLLCFDRNDPDGARKAIQNITVLRIYHQMNRILLTTPFKI